MTTDEKYNIVQIRITTYQEDKVRKESKLEIPMDTKNKRKGSTHYICSMCLNPESNENTTSCPLCHRRANYDLVEDNADLKRNAVVQTSQVNVGNADLLTEVLTVFQRNKKTISKEKFRGCKDVAVVTDTGSRMKIAKPRLQLTISKIFQFSINSEDRHSESGDFVVVNSSQPVFYTKSYNHLDLTKYKSSSVPQMKVEVLKKSLQEKVKSKDAVEEVNRMFACVRRNELISLNVDDNRPLVRHGPRVLPVVKTYNTSEDKTVRKQDCKCCQTSQINMSGGDSILDCSCKERCERRYTCRHYETHIGRQTGVQYANAICKCCRNKSRKRGQERDSDVECGIYF